jgi:hypothetical protein
MAAKETINAIQIAVLAGAKATGNYASNRLRSDPTFPRPIIDQQVSGGVSWWFKDDIVKWLAAQADSPKAPTGRHAVKLKDQRHSIDLTLALQLICAKGITRSSLRESRHVRLVLNQRYSGESLC